MEQKEMFIMCKNLGCCDSCCLRYLGVRNPKAFDEDINTFVAAIKDTGLDVKNAGDGNPVIHAASVNAGNPSNSSPAKKRKVDTCVSCLGLLQGDVWPECITKVKKMLEIKQYDCTKFACALSAPIATILRDKAVTLRLEEVFVDYDPNIMTPLKEAWKWTFGKLLAVSINKTLDSGAVTPLLITITIDYPNDLQELEILKELSPELFEMRSKHKKRFSVEFTRPSVDQALDTVSLEELNAMPGWESGLPRVIGNLSCVSVMSTRMPLYLGGRYIKQSRELPQTPWIVNGKRMMDSSVQEIIFGPIAKMYGLSLAESEHRLKFISAGREDVDVRCLGDGRPFAIEILDPNRQLTAEELKQICKEISTAEKVVVRKLVPVTKEDLGDLKKGEESKCKTYEALCIKLTHSEFENKSPEDPITVTDEDIQRLNTFTNTDKPTVRVDLCQKTPIRVLHRRPLLVRSRQIMEMTAHHVPGYPQLFVLQMQTSAGAYVKEAVHGELGRSQPTLGTAIGARLDILALDVAKVHLNWPDK